MEVFFVKRFISRNVKILCSTSTVNFDFSNKMMPNGFFLYMCKNRQFAYVLLAFKNYRYKNER